MWGTNCGVWTANWSTCKQRIRSHTANGFGHSAAIYKRTVPLLINKIACCAWWASQCSALSRWITDGLMARRMFQAKSKSFKSQAVQGLVWHNQTIALSRWMVSCVWQLDSAWNQHAYCKFAVPSCNQSYIRHVTKPLISSIIWIKQIVATDMVCKLFNFVFLYSTTTIWLGASLSTSPSYCPSPAPNFSFALVFFVG